MAGSNYDIHAKILRIGQYRIEDTKFIVQAPKVFRKTKEQEIDESTKRIDELKDEMKKMEQDLASKMDKTQKDSEEIVEKAEAEAERIVKESETSAFDRVKKSLEEKEAVIQEKRKEAEIVINEAKNISEEMINNTKIEAEKIKETAKNEGFNVGRDEGFEAGKNELISMIDRLKLIISTMLQEREKILVHSERQIMNLVITMVKKIVKKLTQEEENVVVNNTKEALSIIRGAMKVYIHVNPSDYDYTTSHKEELIKLIEGMPEVKIFEDPAVDKGGVYIETDVGDVDAKIATQLDEIEDKIRFYIPVKVKTKGMEDSIKENAVQENDQSE